MSLVVTVAVTVAEGDQVYVNVGRSDSVLPVTADGPGLDLIDLARAALGSIGSDVLMRAEAQVIELRALLAQLEGS